MNVHKYHVILCLYVYNKKLHRIKLLFKEKNICHHGIEIFYYRL